ncbi:hypothetical protein [Mycolicibacterium agri]|uniref:hypothetical protein n=1 Tax=Mycolicibacterium agri TaxID=36811 RepID=UPI0010556854|nr:hypothetical protein [Mycolicibacterium agri]
MLDTNPWSRIGEERTAPTFVAALRDMGYTFVLPPSMLIEAMQTPNVDTRRHIVAAMSSGQGLRLRTEVDLCTNEFRTALQRKRPAWLRSIPNAAAVAGWRAFWTNQVWHYARDDSEQFHDHVMSRPSLVAVDDWYETQLRRFAAEGAPRGGGLVELGLHGSGELGFGDSAVGDFVIGDRIVLQLGGQDRVVGDVSAASSIELGLNPRRKQCLGD